MRGPRGGAHPGLDQLDRGLLGEHRLARRAECGDTRQQGERRGGGVRGGIGNQALADQLLDRAGDPVPLAPPGAEQFADHQLGVQRAAHGQQFTRRLQQLTEQRVGRVSSDIAPCWPAGGLAATTAARAHADSLSDLVKRTLREEHLDAW